MAQRGRWLRRCMYGKLARMVHLHPLQSTRAGVLDVAWYGCGPANGPPVFLMHGFPYDIHAYAEVAPRLAQAGCRVIVPHLRGFGPTRFHGERGRAGLAKNRRALCRLLWELWSPTWKFDEATFERSAAAFDNDDFVDVVIHSYRHRYGLVPGDPAYAAIEARLALQPAIAVPTITFDGADDGVYGPRPPEANARTASPARVRTASCRAWATTCRRRRRRSLLPPCWSWCARKPPPPVEGDCSGFALVPSG